MQVVWRAYELRPEPHAAAALGITGVPAFVANRGAALIGVQTVPALRRLVEHVRVAI
ncbi:MAG TPA: hypothetical protein VGO08_05625 [Burkholderiales bacterium]|nr:hypothetical protein [Burkholderiales bacterium]